MSVTFEQVLAHLNLDDVDAGPFEAELTLYFDAADAWIASKVTDTTLAPVKLATLFLIEHWWKSQRGPATPFSDGEDEYVTLGGVGYAIPNRVRELLGPYLTSSAPAGDFPDAVAWPDPVEWVS